MNIFGTPAKLIVVTASRDHVADALRAVHPGVDVLAPGAVLWSDSDSWESVEFDGDPKHMGNLPDGCDLIAVIGRPEIWVMPVRYQVQRDDRFTSPSIRGGYWGVDSISERYEIAPLS